MAKKAAKSANNKKDKITIKRNTTKVNTRKTDRYKNRGKNSKKSNKSNKSNKSSRKTPKKSNKIKENKKNKSKENEELNSEFEKEEELLLELTSPGQRYPTPPAGDATRAFYESLLNEKPGSLMAIKYCVDYGCCSDNEKAKEFIKILEQKKGKKSK